MKPFYLQNHLVHFISVILCVGMFSIGCATKKKLASQEDLDAAAVQAIVDKEIAKAEKNNDAIVDVEAFEIEEYRDQNNLVMEKNMLIESEAFAVSEALARIHFDYDQYTLSDEARNILKTNFNRMQNVSRQMQKFRVMIVGHADERGSEEYNLALGQKRAEQIKSYLINLGMSENNILTSSMGEELPLSIEKSESGWALNRRVEFELNEENQ